MQISRAAYAQLKHTEELLKASQHERDNIRKAYEEVNKQYEAHRKHFEQNIEQLTRELGASRGSQVHVTAELEGIRKIATKFAREKERDGETIARLTEMLEQVMKAGQQVQGDLERLERLQATHEEDAHEA